MADAQKAYRRLGRLWLDRLSGPQSGRAFSELRPGLPHLSKVLDWACSGHDLPLAQELLDLAETPFDMEGLGEKTCEWSAAVLMAARAGAKGLSVLSALRSHAHALRSRARLRTDPGVDLRQAFLAYDEAFQRAGTPALEARMLGERGLVLGDLAAVAGENRALRLRQSLDDYNSALLRTEPGSDTYLVLQNNRVIVLPQLASLPGQDRPALLRQALTIVNWTLEHYRDDPARHTSSQLNRASLLHELSHEVTGPERGNLLRQGLQATEEALAGAADSASPELGKVLVARANLLTSLAPLPGEDRLAWLREALAAFDQAIAALRNSPLDYATLQNNRSRALIELARSTDDPEERTDYLQRALASLDEALVLRRSTSHEKAGTLYNRAVVLELMAREPGPWPRVERLHESLASAIGALATADAAQHELRREVTLKLLHHLRKEILDFEGQESFDRWWSELTDQPQLVWSAEETTAGLLDRNQEILLAYLRSQSSEERRRLLRIHSRELLAEETLDLLAVMARETEKSSLRSDLEELLGFLRRCRELGGEAAIREADTAAPPPPPHLAAVLEAIQEMSPEERRTYLSERPELCEELKRLRYVIEVTEDPYVAIRDNSELLEVFLRFFGADEWDEARRIFDEQPAAILRHGDLLLRMVGETRPDKEPIQRRIRIYGRLLRRCGEVGADAAFAEVAADAAQEATSQSRLLELFNAERLSRAFRVLAEAPPEFFSEITFEVLGNIALMNPDEGARQRIEFFRTLLRRSLVEGLRPAFAATLARSFAQAGPERRAALFEDAREVLTLEEIDGAFDPLLEASAARPEIHSRIEEARRVLRRAWEIGFEAAQAEMESRQQRAVGASNLLMEFMDLRGVEQRQFVAKHREALLDPLTLDALDEMIGNTPAPPSDGGEDSVRSLRSLLRLLRCCSEIGIEEAFDERGRVLAAVLALTQAPSREERLAVARENADVLLGEETDIVLYDLGHQFAGQPVQARRFSRWREALRRAREEGLEPMVERAHAEEERERRMRAGIAALLTAEDTECQRRVLVEYADFLLTEEAEQEIVQALRQMQMDPDYDAQVEEIREAIAQYRNLLRRCRAHGIEAAFLQIEEDRQREDGLLDELAGEIERLEERLAVLAPSARARLVGRSPLLFYRVRQLLHPRGNSGLATPDEEIRAAALPAVWQLFQAGRLDLKQEFVERFRSLLLSDETDRLLGQMQQGDSEALSQTAKLHQHLLRRCRETGVTTAFAELAFSLSGTESSPDSQES